MENKYSSIRFILLIVLWLTINSICSNLYAKTTLESDMHDDKYLYDENHTRLQLIKSIPGIKVLNWFFLPGGPGVDSKNLEGLVRSLNTPGNYWLIDLPGNGTNDQSIDISTDTLHYY